MRLLGGGCGTPSVPGGDPAGVLPAELAVVARDSWLAEKEGPDPLPYRCGGGELRRDTHLVMSS